MSESVFPEQSLASNSVVSFIEPKNRKFAIESEKNYEVSLLDKGDLIRISEG